MKSSTLKLTTICVAGLLLSACALKPEAVTNQARFDQSQHDLASLLKAQPKVTKPISLSNAIARALKYNLDNRIQLARLALANGELTMAKLDMLPGLDLGGSYTGRSNRKQSYTISNGALTTSDTTVNPRETHTLDITATWDVLDFGLNYLAAKQQADRVLIAQEQKRKAIQTLIQQVTTAYWRAYNAQQMFNDVEKYRAKVASALKKAQAAQKGRLGSGVAQLEFQNLLIDSLKSANSMRTQMLQAREDLAKLMSLPPNSNFKLLPPSKVMQNLPAINAKLPQMDTLALVYRPELREMDYKVRIAKRGVTETILNALPGVDFDLGYNYDSNQYELRRNWISWNTNLAWDAMKLVTTPYEHQIAKTEKELEDLQRMAMTMSVLTQVRLSYIDYQQARTDYLLSTDKNRVTQQLFKYTVGRQKAKAGSKQQVISRSLQALNSQLGAALSFAKAEASMSSVMESVGIDWLPTDNLNSLSLNQLTNMIQTRLNKYHKMGINQIISSHYKTLSMSLAATRISLMEKKLPKTAMLCDGGKSAYNCVMASNAKALTKTKATPVTTAKGPTHCVAKNGHWDCGLPSHSASLPAAAVTKPKMAEKAPVHIAPVVVKPAHATQAVTAPAKALPIKKAQATSTADPFNCSKTNGVWNCSMKTAGVSKPAPKPEVTKVSHIKAIPAAIKEHPSIKANPVHVAAHTVKSGPFACHTVNGVWKCALNA